jgi:hypothetical protein
MKLRYTEHRTTVTQDHVEASEDFTGPMGFRDVMQKEIAICKDYGSYEAAEKLAEWGNFLTEHEEVQVGEKMVHHYGTGLDPVGTWEIIA